MVGAGGRGGQVAIHGDSGHTPESICILLTDTEVFAQPHKILTGDTLFIGDIGRPDLAGGKGYTPEMMATMMYDSLHEKLLRLLITWKSTRRTEQGRCVERTFPTRLRQRSACKRNQLRPEADVKDAFVRMMTADLLRPRLLPDRRRDSIAPAPGFRRTQEGGRTSIHRHSSFPANEIIQFCHANLLPISIANPPRANRECHLRDKPFTLRCRPAQSHNRLVNLLLRLATITNGALVEEQGSPQAAKLPAKPM